MPFDAGVGADGDVDLSRGIEHLERVGYGTPLSLALGRGDNDVSNLHLVFSYLPKTSRAPAMNWSMSFGVRDVAMLPSTTRGLSA